MDQEEALKSIRCGRLYQRTPRIRKPYGSEEWVDKLWRAEYRYYSVVIDADCELYGSSNPELVLIPYKVLKRTPCGAWIEDNLNRKRFVKLGAGKKYACETIEDALKSLERRREVQIAKLESQLRSAKEEYIATKEVLSKLQSTILSDCNDIIT